jgi:signal transduction histidine kinase
MTRIWFAQRLFIPLFGLFLIALLWLGVLTQDSRIEAVNESSFRLELTNTVRLLDAHTRSVILGLDQVVMHIKAEYEDDPARFDLAAQVARSPILKGLSVQVGIIDADGILAKSTAGTARLNLADREHFRVHVERDSGELFVSKPVLGRASGKWSIQLTRRLNTKSGDFAGVVVVSLSPDYITDIYRQIDLGRDAAIIVVGQDGILRARAAGDDRTPGQSIADAPFFPMLWQESEGFVTGLIATDAVLHVGAFRRLATYPLAVIVSRPASSMADRHAREHNLFLLVGLCGSILIGAGSALLLLLALRQQTTEHNLRLRESELIAARNDLERRNRDMEQFTEVLAHHLQEPVRLQMAFATRLQRLLEGVLTDETRPALDHVVNGATRLRALLRDVQLYLAVGLLPPARIACDVNAAIDVALTRLHAGISRSQAVIKRGPLTAAIIDQNRLADVFAALIENALTHHLPDAPPMIEITERRDGRMSVIEVTDTGIGIPEEFRERVFRVFERLNPESGRPGTGIGLPLVKKIIEAAGGRIWIEAPAAGGTRVCFSIPAQVEK